MNVIFGVVFICAASMIKRFKYVCLCPLTCWYQCHLGVGIEVNLTLGGGVSLENWFARLFATY